MWIHMDKEPKSEAADIDKRWLKTMVEWQEEYVKEKKKANTKESRVALVEWQRKCLKSEDFSWEHPHFPLEKYL